MNWSLDSLYMGFDTDKFKNDFEDLKLGIDELNRFAEDELLSSIDARQKIEKFILLQNGLEKYNLLDEYANLILSVDTENSLAIKYTDALEEIRSEAVRAYVIFEEFIKNELRDEFIQESELLKEHEFHLNEIKEMAKYSLTAKEEFVISKLTQTGSGAFSKQWEQLTGSLVVEFEDYDGIKKQQPLAVIRSLAYDKSKSKRLAAYKAELAAYKKIDRSVAFSLNSIKGEVITLSKLRGYNSPLSMTLIHSRMDEEVFYAMMRAISNKIEVFKKYFQKKSEVLGYKNGLPFYELFAPLGDSSLSFTYDEAKIFVVDNLTSFSPRLGGYAKKAFCSKWIDATPKEGKRGGAFCSNIHYLGESRILTNFTGSFNDVLTLAHELGHGYHGDCLNRASYLNSDYPMPIAETASTLCETILIRAALKNALKDEASAILENDISSSAQVIVDIYSRFLFESRVFELREKGSLTVKEFKEIMINSQVEAYRGALDSDYLHPYMWVCKPHYYYPDHNFYNFPYAYGLLFAKALYARYEEIGDEFSKLYDDMLAQTGKHDLKGIANIIGMDVTKEEFFINSLNVIEKEIDQLISLL